MNPTTLRLFAKRYGTAGVLLVGVCLVARHLWMKRRVGMIACIAGVLAGAIALNSCHSRPARIGTFVSRGAHQLYLDRVHLRFQMSPDLYEKRLLEYWADGAVTDDVRRLAHEFDLAAERKGRVHAVSTGNLLCHLFQPVDYFKQDGKWFLHASLGEIYLEEGWLDDAQHEFETVLAAVPPGEPLWGKSTARQKSAYGLAHIKSMQGSFQSALKLLAQAPGEYNTGCGNHNQWVATENYPMKVVWTTASKPFQDAELDLEAVMRGSFRPMESDLNGDTSEDQRHHAAVEAALTLGCLYDKAGRCADAEACWSLIASNADAKYQAVTLSRAMLRSVRQ